MGFAKPRIAVGGFQHETNTFAPKPTTYDHFVAADGWPGLTRGAAIFEALAGYNIGLSGLIDGGEAAGFELLPLAWAYGGAGGTVEQAAFERIAAMLLADLEAALPVDGVLIDLHGAMVTERHDSGDAAFLRRLRDLVGPSVPIVASLDLHANVTAEMVALADELLVYRTYPHVDMAETGRRAAAAMARRLARGKAGGHKAYRQLPFLIPNSAACTLFGPAKAVYDRLAELERSPGVDHLSLACGFNAAAVPHCGPAILGYGPDRAAVEAAVDQLQADVLSRESEFGLNLWSVEDAVRHAIANARPEGPPTILADVQDNYGGGAESDTNWILAELVRQGAGNAVVGVLRDAEVAAAAQAAGVGAEIEIGLGGKSGLSGHRPFHARFRVEALGDGRIRSSGIYFAGGLLDLGPMALLSVGGTRVVVSTRVDQAADEALFTHLGVDPRRTAILSLKSSVHYRAVFQPLAAEILEVDAPGLCEADNRRRTYRRLRPGLRIMPGGPAA